MTLVSFIGPRPNMLGLDRRGTHKRLEVAQPILTNEDMEQVRRSRELTRRRVPLRRRSTSPTRPAEGAVGHGAALDRLCADAERRGALAGVQHHHPLRPRRRRATASPIPALLATAACTSTWSARACARGPASSSRPARRARCTTSRCSPATAPRPSTPTSPSRRSSSCDPQNSRGAQRRRACRRATSRPSARAAQGDVQDGHLDLPVLLRRADLRGGRACVRASSTSTSPAPHARSRASGLREIARGDACARHRAAYGDAPVLPERARRRRRLRLPHARRGARLDAGRRSPTCSTRCAATCRTTYRDVRQADQRPEPSGS